MTKTKVLIDMHNYGFTLYNTNNKYILNIMKFFEIFWI